MIFGLRSLLAASAAVTLALTSHLHDYQFMRLFFTVFLPTFALLLIISALSTKVRSLRVLLFVQAAESLLALLLLLSPLAATNQALISMFLIWLLAIALADVGWGAATRFQWSPTDTFVVGGLGVVTTVAVVVMNATPVEVLGLFGGYCAMSGVYLAIAVASMSAPKLQHNTSKAQ